MRDDDDDPIEGDEQPKTDDDGDAFSGCFAIIALTFVPTAAILSGIGFWQVGWPWAFGALAGLAGGATLCVIWYLLLRTR